MPLLTLNYACPMVHGRWSRMAILSFVLGNLTHAVILLCILPLVAVDLIWGQFDMPKTVSMLMWVMILPVGAAVMGNRALRQIQGGRELRGQSLADWGAFFGNLWLLIYAGGAMIMMFLTSLFYWG